MKMLSGRLSDLKRGYLNHISGHFQSSGNLRGMRKKMTVLVDSWAWIEYFRGTPIGAKQVAEILENSDEKVIVSTINIAEVYNAFLKGYPYPKNERFAENATKAIKERSYIYDVDEEIAVESARLKHKMKWGLGDYIVYATGQREGAKVLTGDPHFKGLKDVIFIEK